MDLPQPNRPLIVVSNRGPLAFKQNESGQAVHVRAGGGLIASLGPAIVGTGATWIASTTGQEPKGLVEAEGFRLLQLPIRPDLYRRYYDVMANGTLWFLHHDLFDLARRPRIDRHWWEAWHSYCEVNRIFGEAVIEHAPENAVVNVHDYHLTLLGKQLREQRPDLTTVHFHHTPFCDRNAIRILPPTAARTMLEGLAGYNACGFHSQRWVDNFIACCMDELDWEPSTFVTAAAADEQELRTVADSPACRAAKVHIDELAGDRKLIVRVDRIEPAKNLLRGFLAYDEFLRTYPRWHGRVTFAAFLYPSRESLAEYLAYRNEVEGLVQQINNEWSTPDWTPIALDTNDDFPRSLAALLRYDVLLVNPIRDGLNLVAKEGAMVNERDGAVVLSREAGSWHELCDAAIGINPFDVTSTSDALVHALEMSTEERIGRAYHLRVAAVKRTPKDWLNDQLRAVGVTI